MNKWMKRPPKMKTLLPMINGIFGHMDYEFKHEITKENLDMLFKMLYGERNPSPVVDYTVEYQFDEEMNDSQLTQLAKLLLAYYKPKWDKLGDIYDIDYDPIHNYLDEWEDHMTESDEDLRTDALSRLDTYNTTVARENTRTDDLEQKSSGSSKSSNTRTNDLTETETRNLTNSSTRTDNLKDEKELNLTDKRTDNTTETRTDNLSQTRTDNLSELRTDDLKHTLDETDSGSENGSESEGYYGFNSSISVPVSTGSNSGTNGNTIDRDSTDTGTVKTDNSGTQKTDNTGTQKTDHTGSVTTDHDGTETRTQTGTQKTEGSEGGTLTTKDTGTQKDAGDVSTEGTVKNTGTRADSGTDKTTGTVTRANTGTQKNEGSGLRDRHGKHYGNIGNLTSQKQILEEIELWKWSYINDILEDAKNLLCLPTYL